MDGNDPDCQSNTAPNADPGGPYNASVGSSIVFDGSASSDPDGSIVSYQWDFGDGSTSTEQNPTHTFDVGTHNVTLTVTNQTTDTTDSYTLSYTAIQPTITYQANAGTNGSMAPSGTVVVDEVHAYKGQSTDAGYALGQLVGLAGALEQAGQRADEPDGGARSTGRGHVGTSGADPGCGGPVP